VQQAIGPEVVGDVDLGPQVTVEAFLLLPETALHLAHHREAKGRSAALAAAYAAATPARDEVALPVPAASAVQGADAV
jgi:hypothetical protein